MEETDDLLSFFMQDKPVKILLETQKNGKTYPADISKALAATYSHIVRVIQKLEEMGLITSEKQGRTKYITLTESGQNVAHHLSGLEMALKRLEESKKKGGKEQEKLPVKEEK
ncbi:MAG: winged helix-turn-helix transcriptional regulator [Candidatus Altiarchaeota archaeon]|nr:winged helix-turn-helix transcriptional regulator [Candidatus Altiarchaeota archaeon]